MMDIFESSVCQIEKNDLGLAPAKQVKEQNFSKTFDVKTVDCWKKFCVKKDFINNRKKKWFCE